MVFSLSPEIGRQAPMFDFDSLMVFLCKASGYALTIMDKSDSMLRTNINGWFDGGKIVGNVRVHWNDSRKANRLGLYSSNRLMIPSTTERSVLRTDFSTRGSVRDVIFARTADAE
jgi:hypothetical protein